MFNRKNKIIFGVFKHLNTPKKNTFHSLVYKIKKSQKFKGHNQSRHEAEKDAF